MSTSSTSTPSSPSIEPPISMASGDLAAVVKVSQRASKSCTECSQRKTKCDKMTPCNGCQKRGTPHLCCVPVHVKKPTLKSLKSRTSPKPEHSAPLPTPQTTENLPLPLPLPLPPPLPSVDPAILHPLYVEIDRLRSIVYTLQSRLHGLESVLSSVFPPPLLHANEQHHARDSSFARSSMTQSPEEVARGHSQQQEPTPVASPVQVYPFYPGYQPHYLPPPPNLGFSAPPPPSSLASFPPTVASEGFEPDHDLRPPPAPAPSALRLTNLSAHPPRFPLPTPTIPFSSSSRIQPERGENEESERKRARITTAAEACPVHLLADPERGPDGEDPGLPRATDGPIQRRGSSSLDKLLSTAVDVSGP